uniref:GH18 domain-containing protein n=2 Tax=Nelumbo nucifera TaxID=4432 RepID=A0A822ZTH6_NELNU|nr:TPA_asm: hypothetical protein HUJ06_003398 [Nelumbo nucifera]
MAAQNLVLLFLVTVLSCFIAGATSAPPVIKGGYWPSWRADTDPPSTIPTSYFTHLFYAFVGVNATTYKLTITSTDAQWMRNFTSTVHRKKPPSKALLSLGGGNASPTTFSNMATNASNRATFIASTIQVARKYGFDGIDLDWEFPKDDQDMSNLAVLFREWRTAFEKEARASRRPRLLISAAVYFASSFFLSDVKRAYPVNAIRRYVDFVSPMCYDYHGSWEPSATGAQALLYDSTSNISTSYGIQSWIRAGVPPKKLVMGLPLYGRTWKLKDPNVHGIGAPAVGVGPGDNGVLLYFQIVEFNAANNATEEFDKKTVSTYSYAGTNWLGYDNATSIRYKVEFARERRLGGYFFWALGYDKDWTLTKEASRTWNRRY